MNNLRLEAKMRPAQLLWAIGAGVAAPAFAVAAPLMNQIIGGAAFALWLLMPLFIWIATILTVLRHAGMTGIVVGSVLFWCAFAASSWTLMAIAASAARA
jgi:hypothetical protein